MDTLTLLLAGLIATTVMIVAMKLIHWLGGAKADMVRAIGSLYTRSHEMSVFPGLLIHYCVGISFVLLYALLVSIAPVDAGSGVFILSLMAGLVHGIMVALLLVILVAEHHPLAEFRKAGIGVGATHVAGHVFYGASLGAFFWITHAKETYLNSMFPRLVAQQLGNIIGFGGLWLAMFGIPLVFGTYLIYRAYTEHLRHRGHDADTTSGHPPSKSKKAS